MRVYDYGEDEAGPFIALEWLPGGTLEARLGEGPLPTGRNAAHRHAESRRDSLISMRAASSIAISSRRTSCSTRRADRSSQTSGWRAALPAPGP